MKTLYRKLLRIIGLTPYADYKELRIEISTLWNFLHDFELAVSEVKTKNLMTEKENARIKAELEERRRQNIEAQKEYLRS